MPGATNKVDDPCEECRNRHLKSCPHIEGQCDDNRPRCSQCERTGQKCCRTKGQRKFRDGSSAQYEKQFAKDQIWIGFSKNAKIQIVDQTAELENFYSIDEPEPIATVYPPERPKTASRPPVGVNNTNFDTTFDAALPQAEPASQSPVQPSTRRTSAALRSPSQVSPSSFDNILSFSGTKRRKTNDSATPSDSYRSIQLPPISQELSKPFSGQDSPSSSTYQPYYNTYASPTEANETRQIEAEYAKLADSEAAKIPDEPLLSFSSWKKNFRWPNQYTTQQCVCLFRYYIDCLGPWFDVGDPSRQFTSVVPQRARKCPPLLNAIFAAAALHLRYASRLRRPGKIIQYAGWDLPDLNQVSTIKYYQATTAYLRALCDNDAHARDEDMLASTVIVRFYEELEELIRGSSQDWAMRPFQLFVTAQAKPELLQHSYEQYDFRIPGSFKNVRHLAEPYLRSYKHSSFRIALRQECQRALLHREEVQLPLRAWKLLDGFDDADDSTWSDRHLYHYANVLQFCFSSKVSGVGRFERWQDLKDFETKWEENRPLSFSYFHWKEPDKSLREVFPQIWYVHEVNATGLLYYHLARILLTVYNPNVPRIGPGTAAAQRKVSEEVRGIVVQLCGIAMSTVQTQPVLVMAYNAIAMFGEHFTDRMEQEALLSVLLELEYKHGWPVSKEVDLLKSEWMWAVSK